MLGHFGFSYIGLLFSLMLIVPNIVFAISILEKHSLESGNKVFLAFERIGEVLSIASLLVFKDYNIQALSYWTLWLIASFVAMLFYDLWWIKYFKSDRERADLYSNFLFIPLAGVTLPPISLILLGIYGKVLWLILASIIFAIGHLGIHLGNLKE